MSAINYQCKELVFHFNKKHLEDPTVPMWILKAHGVTFYVNHVDATIPWSTKETPDNPHTKGSLKFKKCKLTIDDNNCATVAKLTMFDLHLPTPKIVHDRVIAKYHSNFSIALEQGEFKHSKIKQVSGGCGTSFVVCDLLDKDELLLASLKYVGDFRILAPNETYYKLYEEQGDYIEEQDEHDELDEIYED